MKVIIEVAELQRFIATVADAYARRTGQVVHVVTLEEPPHRFARKEDWQNAVKAALRAWDAKNPVPTWKDLLDQVDNAPL